VAEAILDQVAQSDKPTVIGFMGDTSLRGASFATKQSRRDIHGRLLRRTLRLRYASLKVLLAMTRDYDRS
jgi:hypothetical protein